MDICKEYKKRYPNEYLNIDGIVEPTTYKAQPIKLLFILKETNQLYKSLVEFLREGAPDGGKLTWQPVCKWIEAIIYGTQNGNYSTAEERSEMLKRIATMNIKKSPGGATSDSSYLEWAKRNKDLLLAQIQEIAPDIIIVCCAPNENIVINEILFPDIETQKFDNTDLWYSTWKQKGYLIFARHPNRAPSNYIVAFSKFNKAQMYN